MLDFTLLSGDGLLQLALCLAVPMVLSLEQTDAISGKLMVWAIPVLLGLN